MHFKEILKLLSSKTYYSIKTWQFMKKMPLIMGLMQMLDPRVGTSSYGIALQRNSEMLMVHV